jgi:hypothetical protein
MTVPVWRGQVDTSRRGATIVTSFDKHPGTRGLGQADVARSRAFTRHSPGNAKLLRTARNREKVAPSPSKWLVLGGDHCCGLRQRQRQPPQFGGQLRSASGSDRPVRWAKSPEGESGVTVRPSPSPASRQHHASWRRRSRPCSRSARSGDGEGTVRRRHGHGQGCRSEQLAQALVANVLGHLRLGVREQPLGVLKVVRACHRRASCSCSHRATSAARRWHPGPWPRHLVSPGQQHCGSYEPVIVADDHAGNWEPGRLKR